MGLIGFGIDVMSISTTGSEHATAEAAKAAADGRTVVAVGGDGLVRDVAAGVVRSGGTMAVVPVGRGNDLAAKLTLPSSDRGLISMLQAGRTRVIDVLDVNGHVVPGNVYAGVDSVAARLINNNRRIPALALYRGAAVAALAKWKPTEFTLTYRESRSSDRDGSAETTLVTRAHDIVIANSGRYGNGLNIVPDASLDDGVIDVLIVRHGSVLRLASILFAAQRGTHIDRDDIDVLRVTWLRVEADRDVPFGADGDEVTHLPAEIKLRPKALHVVVP